LLPVKRDTVSPSEQMTDSRSRADTNETTTFDNPEISGSELAELVVDVIQRLREVDRVGMTDQLGERD
jgi:hypothetical protein